MIFLFYYSLLIIEISISVILDYELFWVIISKIMIYEYYIFVLYYI